jgi:OPT oligopeptide transporter protein
MGVMAPFFAYLTVGVNSSILTTFALGFVSQYYMRKYRPEWFNNYNYIVSAGLDAGTQISVFIINLTVLGAANTVPFPHWALYPKGNPDYCPAQAK